MSTRNVIRIATSTPSTASGGVIEDPGIAALATTTVACDTELRRDAAAPAPPAVAPPATAIAMTADGTAASSACGPRDEAVAHAAADAGPADDPAGPAEIGAAGGEAEAAGGVWPGVLGGLRWASLAVRRRWGRRIMTAEERANWGADAQHAVYLASLGGHPARR